MTEEAKKQDAYMAKYDGCGEDWISASCLSCFQLCAVAGCKRYLERIPEPRGVRATIGTGAHKGRCHNLTQKIESGVDVQVEEVLDAARDDIVETFSEHEMVLKGTEFEGKPRTMCQGIAVDIAVEFATADYDRFQTEIMPKYVECVWQVQFDGMDRSVIGTSDVVDVDNAIRDLKTGQRKKGQSWCDTDQGLTTYGLLRLAADGVLTPDYFIENVVQSKKGVATELYHTTRTEEDINRQLARFQRVLDVISTGVFLPANPGDWKCGPQYCGYYPTCEFGGG